MCHNFLVTAFLVIAVISCNFLLTTRNFLAQLHEIFPTTRKKRPTQKSMSTTKCDASLRGLVDSRSLF